MKLNVDLYKKYFDMSFRYNKCKPEDFGLIESQHQNLYINQEDSSLWLRRDMYDFGWGSEYGFMRLPMLTFEEAWYLLLNSPIEENQYGAANLIETEYADELLSFLLALFSSSELESLQSYKTAFEILQLNVSRNRTRTIGKSYDEVIRDSENWKYISEQVKRVLK